MSSPTNWKGLWIAGLAFSVCLGVGCNSVPCGGSGNACCGAGVCNQPLVCIAGMCGANTASTPKTATELCQLLAQGEARRDALGQLSAQVALISAVDSPACNATVDQRIAVQSLQMALVTDVGVAVQSSACGDPLSEQSQRAARIAAGLDADRIVWNGPAEASCQKGLLASAYLTAAVLSPDGGFAGEEEIFGPSGKQGSAPCDELLQGQLDAGQSCQDSAECQPGLYCRPASETGCGGTCAVPDGGCGPLDLCPGQTISYVSLGSGLQSSLPIGSPCDAGAGCGPCERCTANRCAAESGLIGAACPCDAEAPLAFCNTSGTCEATHVLGDACNPGAGDCLIGSCLGSPPTCSPPGSIGDPCNFLLTPACDAGVCVPNADGGVCQPFPDAGQACILSQCGPGAVCDPDSNTCQVPRPGGQPCELGPQCQSGYCVVPDGGEGDAGVCLSACLQPPDGGCLNLYSSSSFLLGLGGALVLQKRGREKRRRRRR